MLYFIHVDTICLINIEPAFHDPFGYVQNSGIDHDSSTPNTVGNEPLRDTRLGEAGIEGRRAMLW